jgi:hypothetical protein
MQLTLDDWVDGDDLCTCKLKLESDHDRDYTARSVPLQKCDSDGLSHV